MYTKKMCPSDVLEEINVKRELMINCAINKGYTSEETIRYSQELDILINHYQKASLQKSNSNKEGKFVFKQMIMVWPNVFV